MTLHSNTIEFEVYGRYACFTDPFTHIGGEKLSTMIPTYQALKGILESIFWKPTIIWHIDEVRVMNLIQTESKGTKPMKYNSPGNTLSYQTCLKNVRYRVRAHFEFNLNRPDLAADRNVKKHHSIAHRALKNGGRRDIFLGTRDCQAYVEPCDFNEGVGEYDNAGLMNFGLMMHGFSYPDEHGGDEILSRLCHITMNNGIIKFPRPEECMIVKTSGYAKPKSFTSSNTQSVENLYTENFPKGEST